LGVELDIVLRNESADASPKDVVDAAVEAEKLGYGTAWLPDHILPPSPYGETFGGVFEPLVLLTAIAARTMHLRLGTSVIVLPLRSPFVLAKQVATLDALSGGRAELGLGAGWNQPEFQSVGADFATRGRRLEEGIHLLRHLFNRAPGGFDGHFYGYEQGVFEPRVVQGGGPPIIVGGMSDAAVRRAARVADGWQSHGIGPDEFRQRVELLRRSADGRRVSAQARMAWTGGRSVEAACEEARAFEQAGADRVAIWFGPVSGFSERMRRFARAFR
jgi:probable F420-dependent oxidoreductase